MHQISHFPGGGAPPTPLEELTALPSPPSWRGGRLADPFPRTPPRSGRSFVPLSERDHSKLGGYVPVPASTTSSPGPVIKKYVADLVYSILWGLNRLMAIVITRTVLPIQQLGPTGLSCAVAHIRTSTHLTLSI